MGSEQEAHLVEKLARAGAVRTRRMFGGLGIYAGDLFFALIANDVLYLKVNERNRGDYEVRGMAPFQPFPDKPSMLSYYELPIDVLDDVRRLKPWVEKALDAAREKGRNATKRRPAQRRARPALEPRTTLAGLGPATRRWLADVGLKTRADLEKKGAVATFLAVKRRGHAANANMLYALEALLLGLRASDLPDVVKQNLRQRAGLD